MHDNGSNIRRPVVAAFMGLFSYAVVMTVPQAAVNELGSEFGISNTALGRIFQLFILGFMASAIGGGRLSDKYGKPRMVAVGSIIMAAGMLGFAASRTYPLLLIAAIVGGIGGGLTEVVATAMVSDLFREPRRTIMQNWAQVTFSVGAFIQPIIFAQLIGFGIGWRSGFMVAAAASILCTLTAAAAMPSFNKQPDHDNPTHAKWMAIVRDPIVVGLCATILLYVGAELGLSSWVAAYLKQDIGTTPARAASSVAVFWVGIGLGRAVGAKVAERVSDGKLIAGSMLIAAVIQALVIISDSYYAVLGTTFASGIFLGPVWPTIMSRAASVYPNQSGAITGIVAAAGCGGAAIVPPLIGFISDLTSLRAALVVCPICLILGFLVMCEKCMRGKLS